MILALVLLGCAIPTPVAPPVQAVLTIDGDREVAFPVTGDSPETLTASLQKVTPAVIPGTWKGHQVRGATRWQLRFKWKTRVFLDKCRVHRVEVGVRSLILMPGWDAPADANPKVVTWWKAYEQQVAEHERTHRKIAMEGGQELLDTLAALPMAPDCDTLAARLREVGHAKTDEIRARQEAFDLENYRMHLQ